MTQCFQIIGQGQCRTLILGEERQASHIMFFLQVTQFKENHPRRPTDWLTLGAHKSEAGICRAASPREGRNCVMQSSRGLLGLPGGSAEGQSEHQCRSKRPGRTASGESSIWRAHGARASFNFCWQVGESSWLSLTFSKEPRRTMPL